MRTAEGYKTKQRSGIEAVLKQTEGRHFTADGLILMLTKNGFNVGRTTVYRCLDRMVSEGRVRRYAQADGGSACYQYVSENSECAEHFHLKCTRCGKLFHIECETMNHLSQHILNEHGFKVDNFKTVLYGVCKECSKD